MDHTSPTVTLTGSSNSHTFSVSSNDLPVVYSASLRVRDIALVHHNYTTVGESSEIRTQSGEAQHVEAKGQLVLHRWHRLTGTQCAMLKQHEHCTKDTLGHDHTGEQITVRDAVDGENLAHLTGSCCLIVEQFPVSLHFEVPIGDGVVPALGDSITLTIQRV